MHYEFDLEYAYVKRQPIISMQLEIGFCANLNAIAVSTED